MIILHRFWIVYGVTSLVSASVYGAEFLAGFGKVDISPTRFEQRPLGEKDENYKRGSPFWDTGVDRLYDFEEPLALGPDGKAGFAGVDDDQDGEIDNCSRRKCTEYKAVGSDDIADPNRDNYHPKKSPSGTEGDGKYQSIPIGGFEPYYPLLPLLPFSQRLVNSITNPIWSRALALSSSKGQTVILVSTDLPGLTWKHINPVRRRIATAYGIDTDHIIITSTHNHSGPDASGYWSSLLPGHNKAYTDELREMIFESIVIALQSLQPASMKVVTTEPPACIDAETKELKNEAQCRHRIIQKGKIRYQKDPEIEDIPVMQNDLRDPFQRNLEAVAAQFISKKSGETISTFINWHAHPDMSRGVDINSDYSHFLREFVERHLGGEAIYFTGTLGNQIGLTGAKVPLWSKEMEPIYSEETRKRNLPIRAIAETKEDRLRSVGYEVGHAVVEALKNTDVFETDPNIFIQTEYVDTQVTNFLHQLGTSSVWSFDVESPDRMRRYFLRCLTRYGCVRSDISVLEIGSLGIVTSPGETDPAYFLGRKEYKAKYGKYGKITFGAMPSIKEQMPGKHKALLGQANNYLSYLVHHTDNIGWWKFNHPVWYEEFVTTDKNFGDDVGNKIMKMLGSKSRYSKRRIYPEERPFSKGTQSFAETQDGTGFQESIESDISHPFLLEILSKMGRNKDRQ